MTVQHLNPDGLHKNPAFSQGVVVPADARMVLIGGQNAVDAQGNIVGKGDIAQQTSKALVNLLIVLEAAGGRLEDLVKVTVVIAQDEDLQAAFRVWMDFWGERNNPPTVKVLRVAGFAHPDFLIEIEAQAVLQ